MFLRFSVIFLNCLGHFVIPNSWFIICYLKWAAQRVQLIKQEMDSPLICIGGSSCSNFILLCSVLIIVFVSFNHCIVCPSSIFGLRLLLWYLQYCLSILKYCTINRVLTVHLFFSDSFLLLWSNITDTSCRCLTRRTKWS
jgi:hypothetical protein